jgi:K(+)-stimulated pyrophosphate-energized sodium pump
MNAVGKAAMEMVYEVRRQFKEIPGIMEGTGKPEYDKCVDISTKASLKQMMLPGLLTIGFPLVIAFLPLAFGMDNLIVAEMLGGYMAGVTVSGVLWAIFQNNAGGAWDNAKKSFEAGVMVDGEMTYKGSEAHKAAVTGDTVGDPFKDTSGPSMNILIKLTCLIGLVLAPILGSGHGDSEETNPSCTAQKECCSKDKKCSADKQECKGSWKGCSVNGKDMKCDMSDCSKMTKQECAAVCDSVGCSQEEKDLCLSHYDQDGKFVGCNKNCCEGNKKCTHKGKCVAGCKKGK